MSALVAVALLAVVVASVHGPRVGAAKRRSGDEEPGADGSDAMPTRAVPEDFADFYHRAPCGFHSLDADGVIIAINDSGLELLQQSRAEVVGRRRFVDFLAPLGRQRFVREFPTFKQSGRVEGLEFDLIRRDGTLLPVVVSSTAVYDSSGSYVGSRSIMFVDRRRTLPEETMQGAYVALEGKIAERTGELTAVIATLREEIDERQRAEELLRESEERAVAVVNSAIDGVITMDENGFIESVNPAAERIFDWPESQLVGRNLALLLPQPYASEHQEDLRRYRDTGDRQIVGSGRELVGRRRDGSTFPLEIALGEMRFGMRRLLRGTLRDLTERKRAEERVAQLQAEVRRNDLMAQIGALVAGFAHEARNPLFGISAVLDAFTARFGDRAEYAEHFTLLRRDVKRLNDLMHDLLEFGRPASALHPRALAPVLAEAVAQCGVLAEDNAVAVELRSAVDEVHVAMNVRLVRAFQNLLQNAIQFSPRGSTVTLETTLAGGDLVQCTVRDQGPGIGAEDLPLLFEPFFTRRRGGTGLGLAIVQRIVDEHRGTIVATNHPDGGAAISVRLPVTAT